MTSILIARFLLGLRGVNPSASTQNSISIPSLPTIHLSQFEGNIGEEMGQSTWNVGAGDHIDANGPESHMMMEIGASGIEEVER